MGTTQGENSEKGNLGCDLDIRLLALGFKSAIVVITAKEQIYARFFPCICPASMHCGVFDNIPINDLIPGWISNMLKPLVIFFNGIDHYNSTKASVYT